MTLVKLSLQKNIKKQWFFPWFAGNVAGLNSNETLHPKVAYDDAVTVDSHYPYVVGPGDLKDGNGGTWRGVVLDGYIIVIYIIYGYL